MRRRVFIATTLLGVAASLTGCASQRKAREAFLPLPAILPMLRAVNAPLQVYQQIHVDIRNPAVGRQSFDFEAMIALSQERMKVALIALGMTLWTIDYDGATLSETRSPHVPDLMKANYLLRDIAMAFWPMRNLVAQATGLMIEEHPRQRRFYRLADQEPVVTIQYREGSDRGFNNTSVEIDNSLEAYRLIIQSQLVS